MKRLQQKFSVPISRLIQQYSSTQLEAQYRLNSEAQQWVKHMYSLH